MTLYFGPMLPHVVNSVYRVPETWGGGRRAKDSVPVTKSPAFPPLSHCPPGVPSWGSCRPVELGCLLSGPHGPRVMATEENLLEAGDADLQGKVQLPPHALCSLG